jgi:hypothetical protein
MNSAADNHARNDPGSNQNLAMSTGFLRGYSRLAPEVVMPVVERILFVVSGVALLAGAFALFSYERTLAERTRTPVFELSAAQSTAVSLPDAGRCAGKASHLMSPLPAAHWREGRCPDMR